MQIVFRPGEGRQAVATLVDPDDFGAFSIGIAQNVPRPLVVAALAEMGPGLDGSHAYVSVAAVKQLAGDRAQDQQWLESLQKMVDYGKPRGWLNEAGDIRGHLERA